MRTTIFVIALLGAVCAFPKKERLPFKNVFVNPLKPPGVIPRITNGHEAVPHSIPYQAYLIVLVDAISGWLCGGSLISPNYVITAAHCLDEGLLAYVYLGAHNPDIDESSTILLLSTDLRVHESYNEDFISNDIGLIKLPSPVTLNEYINVVPIPKRSEDIDYEGKSARMSGWGLTEGDGDLSPVLLEVNATVISNSLCNSIYGIVIDSQICTAGSGGVGTCDGDSGGPLVIGNELVGITSYGVEDCLPGYPSAFTRVTSFWDWLEQYTDLTF